MIKPDSPHSPTFTPTRPRSAWQRLTPLGWFALGLLGFVCLAAAFALGAGALRQTASQRTLTDVLAVPTAAAGSTAAPTAVVVGSARATWADAMTRGSDGTWLAPPEVIEAARADLLTYERASQRLTPAQALHDLPALREKYGTPEWMAAGQAGEGPLVANVTGDVQVMEVKRFSADGLTAQAGLVMRNVTYDLHDRATLKPVAKGSRQDDALVVIEIRYRPETRVWQRHRVIAISTLPKP